MDTISPLISQHRDRLKSESRINRYVLLGAMFMALVMFSIFLLTFFGDYPLPFWEGLFADNPERLIGASNFFVATAIGSALKMWRVRQLRIKMLIAEAFIREDDEDTGMRLLLEPVFGEAVWAGARNPTDPKPVEGAA